MRESNKFAKPFGRRAFTLIELLIVIAIIAIIVAILVPVFDKAREKARQETAMSNLKQISSAAHLYYLDHDHAYPPVLFGYADSSSGALPSMVSAKAEAGTNNNVLKDFPGLYPTYVSDYHVFEDPDNTADEDTATPSVNTYARPTGVGASTSTETLSVAPETFYAADAYDVSPQILGTNSVAPGTYVARYQVNWTNINPALNVVDSSGRDNYMRQLRWGTSSAGDSYLTCTTYHVAAADKVIVLFENGTAKAIDSSHFLAAGPDVTDITTGNAKFWTVSPTQ